jgi:hypothetical protein
MPSHPPACQAADCDQQTRDQKRYAAVGPGVRARGQNFIPCARPVLMLSNTLSSSSDETRQLEVPA